MKPCDDTLYKELRKMGADDSHVRDMWGLFTARPEQRRAFLLELVGAQIADTAEWLRMVRHMLAEGGQQEVGSGAVLLVVERYRCELGEKTAPLLRGFAFLRLLRLAAFLFEVELSVDETTALDRAKVSDEVFSKFWCAVCQLFAGSGGQGAVAVYH